jgi:DNA-binding MarR family transcriptional regulator
LKFYGAGMTASRPSDEPVAYVTGLAYESVVAFLRARHAELGFTHPQFWLLRNLSRHDLLPDGGALTIPELRRAMSSYLRPEDDLAAEADVLVGRGWLTREGEDGLRITEAGEEARVELKAHAPAIRARIHEGIDEADYATTVKVLHRLIRNTKLP